MQKVAWKVDGMTCANCALSINRTLDKQGMQKVKVNAVTGDVSFETEKAPDTIDLAKNKIEGLGYKVHEEHDGHNHHGHNHHDQQSTKTSPYMLRFWISLPFTAILMLHMIPGLHIHWLMLPWVQFGLALPVYLIGMEYFGKSAFHSIRSGIPNMDVLIALGSTAAFFYSCYGLFTSKPQDFLFFETAASIITIVLFGNWLENISVQRTQREIKKLSRQQVITANMIAYDDQHNENIFTVDNTALKTGDLILIKTGEQVPMDCKILWGDAEVNEAIITGESIPVYKTKNDILIGGSVLVNGTVKCYVSAVGKDTVMSSIVELMKKAQTEKPPVQKLADKISAIFVPAVLVIALLTLLLNMFAGGHDFKESLLRSVAVLVIACPCAMGLATPAAIAVGLSRAAKKGILYTDVSRMELFRNVKQIVFDKTGTLTTGRFVISGHYSLAENDAEFRKIVYSLEKFSNHPIAKSITQNWKTADILKWKKIEEIKGIGMKAVDKEGNIFMIGSDKIVDVKPDAEHNLYVTRNGELIGWLDMQDEIRPEAKDIIRFCNGKGIKTILLSGDKYQKCKAVADELGISTFLAEQSPLQKLEKIEELSKESTTVMVGDGINDAPALAKATISISLSEASNLAIQSSSVVLTNNGLKNLPVAIMLGKQTYNTVKSNLFWAFIYNIIAIPIAAVGLLHPTFGALIMGGSDVVLAGNSLYLGIKKLK
ncbi:MAG: cation-translocating P-type ATPase [Bacteroidota bacterium]